ncbi:MAG: tRNA pseudouridine synthase A [Candidatus Poribacteria bacterium]|nr:MAG: tRNA pseudouridine synthase A [Candidatus Poribacteria bacterium]
MPRNIALTLEYDGTDYAGWQAQRNALAVQTVVEEALASVLGEKVRLIASGRTDAGVHAAGQVANFQTRHSIPLRGLFEAVNSILPPDIRVVQVAEMPPSFHARHSAIWRTYRYYILNRPQPSVFWGRFSWHIPHPLPVSVWDRLGKELVGKRDFSSFEKKGGTPRSPVCTLASCRTWRDGDLVILQVTSHAFLRGMVRAIVGTLYKLAPDLTAEFEEAKKRLLEILEAKTRSAAGRSAPARGLCLWRVTYSRRFATLSPEAAYPPLKSPAGSLWEPFGEEFLQGADEDETQGDPD